MGDLGFDSRAIQIGHRVANDLPPLQHFLSMVRSCVGKALSHRDELRNSVHFLKTYLRFLIMLERITRAGA